MEENTKNTKVDMKCGITLDEALDRSTPHLRKKILASVELLRKAESLALKYNQEDGFWLAFSGGKDSQAIFHVAELAGVRFKAHMNFTSIDQPSVVRFVKRQYPEVHTIPPKISIYNKAIKHGLPTRVFR